MKNAIVLELVFIVWYFLSKVSFSKPVNKISIGVWF